MPVCSWDLQKIQHVGQQEMNTLMVPNLKLRTNDELEFVDATLYFPLIGSLMYLVDTLSDLCYAMHTMTQFMIAPRQNHMLFGTSKV